MEIIRYRDGYKYQLVDTYMVQTPIIPDHDVDTRYIALNLSGMLTIRDGYAWDGASGPTIDTSNSMRASLVHDAFYALMRDGCIEHKQWRDTVDRLLQAMCIEDGMWKTRAWMWYMGVRWGAGPCVMPSHYKPIQQAP